MATTVLLPSTGGGSTDVRTCRCATRTAGATGGRGGGRGASSQQSYCSRRTPRQVTCTARTQQISPPPLLFAVHLLLPPSTWNNVCYPCIRCGYFTGRFQHCLKWQSTWSMPAEALHLYDTLPSKSPFSQCCIFFNTLRCLSSHVMYDCWLFHFCTVYISCTWHSN